MRLEHPLFRDIELLATKVALEVADATQPIACVGDAAEIEMMKALSFGPEHELPRGRVAERELDVGAARRASIGVCGVIAVGVRARKSEELLTAKEPHEMDQIGTQCREAQERIEGSIDGKPAGSFARGTRKRLDASREHGIGEGPHRDRMATHRANVPARRGMKAREQIALGLAQVDARGLSIEPSLACSHVAMLGERARHSAPLARIERERRDLDA
jgi:hypothetical protein